MPPEICLLRPKKIIMDQGKGIVPKPSIRLQRAKSKIIWMANRKGRERADPAHHPQTGKLGKIIVCPLF
jgi:hypothetical protein